MYASAGGAGETGSGRGARMAGGHSAAQASWGRAVLVLGVGIAALLGTRCQGMAMAISRGVPGVDPDDAV